jgi:hypothetical protein
MIPAMTIREAIQWVGQYSLWLAIGLVVPPALAFLSRFLHGVDNGGKAPWKYVYSVLVYWVCFPGMLSSVLTGYSLFFEKADLLDVSVVVYILPIVSMVATLILVRKNVSFEDVPGFDRISGLLTMIGVTFVLTLAIYKTRILLGFFGSLPMLIALVAGLFGLLKWGTYMLFRKKDEPKSEPPTFPSLPGQ